MDPSPEDSIPKIRDTKFISIDFRTLRTFVALGLSGYLTAFDFLKQIFIDQNTPFYTEIYLDCLKACNLIREGYPSKFKRIMHYLCTVLTMDIEFISTRFANIIKLVLSDYGNFPNS